MSDPNPTEDALANMSREEMMSALFAHLIIQNTNMALMFLGKVPHPQSGETVQDLEAAKMFIDQLEMLEAKTKGNLTKDEEKLLKQSLTHLHMTFVEAVEKPLLPDSAKKPEAAATPEPSAEPPPPVDAGEGESRKRFSKKF
ncbi:MAG TPA: DUF1844 domain-containing protein [Verrucomicrobiae bacterium]|jgi:hypothetical protein